MNNDYQNNQNGYQGYQQNGYQGGYQDYPQTDYYGNNQGYPQNNEDKGSFGWAVFGFCFPLIGLILFAIWKNNKPKSSKKAGIGALVGFIFSFIAPIIFYALIWGAVQNSVVDQACATTFGEGYKSVKKDNVYYCKDPNSGELIKIE